MITYRLFLFLMSFNLFECASSAPCMLTTEILTTINVNDYGVNGNDSNDDWEKIQCLIDQMLNQGGGTLFFPKGTYYIDNRTLLIWGNNLTLKGESEENTKIIRRGKAGWWGELLSISGKSTGGKYYGGFGFVDYNRFTIYKGERIPSKNITVKNITFDSEIPFPIASNNIAIINSRNIVLENCIIQNAAQTNLAIVNVTDKAKNKNIQIKNCIFKKSGQHNVRVISYNQGSIIGNSVTIQDSKFLEVKNEDRSKEIKEKKVHLFYRAGLGGDKVSLKIKNCFFDETGIIAGTVNINNLIIENSVIKKEVEFINNNRNYPKPKIKLINNQYSTSKKQDAIKSNTDYILK